MTAIRRPQVVPVALAVLIGGIPSQAQTVLVADLFANTIKVLGPNLTVTNTVPLPLLASPVNIAVNSSGTVAAVVNSIGRVDFLDLGNTPPSFTGPSVLLTGSGTDGVFSPGGECLVVATGGISVEGVDVTTRIRNGLLTGFPVLSVAMAPGNLVLAAEGFGGSLIRVLTLGSGCTLMNTGTALATGGTGPRAVTVSPNGRIALVSNSSGTVGVFHITGSSVSFVKSIPIPGGVPVSTAFLPDSRRAYVHVISAPASIRILNVDGSDNVVDSGISVSFPNNGIAFDQRQLATDGRNVLATGFLGSLLAIDVGTNAVTTIVLGGSPGSIAVRGALCPPHRIHGHISTVPPSHSGAVAHEHHGQHGHSVASGCPPHASGHSALVLEPEGGSLSLNPATVQEHDQQP